VHYILVDDKLQFFSGFMVLVIKLEIVIVEFINDANILGNMLALHHIEKLSFIVYASLS